MATRFTRETLLSRIHDTVRSGRGVVLAGAGSGIAAKFLERGGIDILGVYNTGYFRMQGYGSLAGMLPIADANRTIYRMAVREVLPQVKHTPVIAGVNGVDPLRDMPRFLRRLRSAGISGVHNFPTVAWFDGEFRRTLEATGLGYDHELSMLRTAKSLGLLTVGYAFNEADTRRLMDQADPDVYIFHAGITAGGSTGDAGAAGLKDTARRSQQHFEVARSIRKDVVLLAHGAAITGPEESQYMLDNTDCQGVQLGSGVERMAMERPLEERARAFSQLRMPKNRS